MQNTQWEPSWGKELVINMLRHTERTLHSERSLYQANFTTRRGWFAKQAVAVAAKMTKLRPMFPVAKSAEAVEVD